MKFKTVWISSIEHLNRFTEITSSSNIFQKIIGYYKIPAHFPYMRFQLMLVFKIPIVFFGNTEVNIERNSISFTSLDYKTFFWRYKNIKQIQFQLNKADIQSIERYKPPSMFLKYYTVDWVRIKTKYSILGGDFLICIGGSGPLMSKIKKSTDDLYNELVGFVQN